MRRVDCCTLESMLVAQAFNFPKTVKFKALGKGNLSKGHYMPEHVVLGTAW